MLGSGVEVEEEREKEEEERERGGRGRGNESKVEKKKKRKRPLLHFPFARFFFFFRPLLAPSLSLFSRPVYAPWLPARPQSRRPCSSQRPGPLRKRPRSSRKSPSGSASGWFAASLSRFVLFSLFEFVCAVGREACSFPRRRSARVEARRRRREDGWQEAEQRRAFEG